ncbi:PilZ domain-containing protein [Vibrio sp. 99-8-1]|uniref:PilZ domain-containing protein n=1 Tax=Vibrio sp. 99-8-1 TaxID=2607602 RepID=UPI001493CDE3|nr:PilZ domain-containing protein [Vibrio sp. 99-8-1]NOI67839.1 PilZ domain-containing protein [Vibrio sp. 99-8-1]
MSVADPTLHDLKKYLQFGMRLSAVISFGPKDQYTVGCQFVGLKENNFLIFELNNRSMEELVVRKVNNVSVVVRGMADTEEGHVIAFKSRIAGIKLFGTWLMFVNYPVAVESKPIRENRRFKVHIGASAKIGKKNYRAELLDISISGCALLIKEPLEVEIGTEIAVDPEIEHLQNVHPKCSVVNFRKQLDGVVLGIEFDHYLDISDELRLEVLQHVVLDH